MAKNTPPSDADLNRLSPIVTHKDQLTIIISSLALFVAIISVGITGVTSYVQWFMKLPKLGVILTSPPGFAFDEENKDGNVKYTTSVTLINSGNQPIAIEKATRNCSPPCEV